MCVGTTTLLLLPLMCWIFVPALSIGVKFQTRVLRFSTAHCIDIVDRCVHYWLGLPLYMVIELTQLNRLASSMEHYQFCQITLLPISVLCSFSSCLPPPVFHSVALKEIEKVWAEPSIPSKCKKVSWVTLSAVSVPFGRQQTSIIVIILHKINTIISLPLSLLSLMHADGQAVPVTDVVCPSATCFQWEPGTELKETDVDI